MACSLIEKIRRARETTLDMGGYSLVIRYPTLSEHPFRNDTLAAVIRITKQTHTQSDFDILLKFISAYVVGWDGVTELMLFPGGTCEPVAFDSELFHEWSMNFEPDKWYEIYSAIMKFSDIATQAKEDTLKN